MDSDLDDSIFEVDDESDFAPKKPVAKAVAKKAAPKPAAPKKLTQTTLKSAPKKRTKPDSDDDDSDLDGNSGYSNTPPKAKKQKSAPAAKKSSGKPLAEIENDSVVLDEPSQPKGKGKKTAEETYQRLTPLQHILKRPDTYIGSVESTEQQMWVFSKESNRMELKKVTFVPGLYKIFDEILVNAADNKQRDGGDHTMTSLKVTIDRSTGEIIVENNGKGIPIVVHAKEKIYIPEMIFGHLLTGSNYDDDEKKTVGGRNGYGAKLTNIFSTEFTIECQDSENVKRYKQTWTENMSKVGKAKVTTSKTSDFVRISFKPDYARFGMHDGIDDDLESLLLRRVYDLAGTIKGVKVFLNGTQIKLNFKGYCEMYAKAIAAERTAEEGTEATCTVITDEKAHRRWEIGFAVSDGTFQQVSFVNSIATTSGGTHVNYIADQITQHLLSALNKKKKGHALKQNNIKNHIFIFVNCLIDNPAFTSQTKEQMTTKVSQFGSKCQLTDDFLKKVAKSEAIQNIMDSADKKADKMMAKTDGAKRSRISNAKLVDANMAGTKRGHECTLILTEGDSAKSLAVAGRAILDPDRIGVFPLRGKMLNVRDASIDQITKNQEIQNIKQFLGLKHKTVYTDTKGLRYGHLMIMADQDHDGSHIKGLLINFLQVQFPSLLQIPDFFREFITPIVKVWQGGNPKKPLRLKSFFTQPQYEEWKETHRPELHRWHYKYFKGLGTSSNEDAQVYFTNLDDHLKEFEVMKTEEADLFDLAFSKKKADARKEWLGSFIPGTYLDHSSKQITYSDFVNKELILFSMADNMRSIPSVIDGFKPGQRKVVYACFKRNLNKDQKVIELAGYVSEQTAYHHGETSLQQTIIGLAQNFVGSNNVNCLEPSGNFGSRLAGGSDAASPRYIHTRLSPFARKVFSALDEPNLEHQYEDGKKIEPRVYAPIIPMVLVNGADGIGTGWSTSIPNYNPIDIVNNLKRRMGRLAGFEGVESPFEPMQPWFRGWKGTAEAAGPDRFKFNGIIFQDDRNPNEIIVTELPIRMWTDDFKAKLEEVISGQKGPVFIKDYKEFNDHKNVHFIIQLDDKHTKDVMAEGLHERFKLNKQVATSNLVAFDTRGQIRKYEKIEDILEEYYLYRLQMYVERKKHWLGVYHADYRKLKNQARFIQEIIDGKLVVARKRKAALVQELRDRQYEPFPKGQDPNVKKRSTDEDIDASESEEEDGGSARDYDYLLSMPIWSLTLERLEKLKEQIRKKKEEHDALEALSEMDLWCRDLDEFVEEWENQLRLDAEIQTNIRRMGRRVSKKIGAGKGGRARDDDDYAPEKKTKAGAKSKAAPKPEVKSHQRFTEAFTARPKAKVEASEDNIDDIAFSDDDFAALGRKPAAPKPSSEETTIKAEEANGRVKRAAAAKPKTWIVSDDDMSFDDDSKLLGDVGAMVKGIGQPSESKANGRLSLFAMSQSANSGGSALPKVRPKPSKNFDFDSHDDTNYEMLAKSSPHKTATKADDLDSFLSDDALPPPKVTTVATSKAASSFASTSAAKSALGVVPAKKRGRPAGAKNKPKDDDAPKAKPKAATAAKSSNLSPAAKAYLAKKGAGKKSGYSDDEDDEDDLLMEASPPPKPAARGRPGRAAAAKAKPVYVLDDDDDEEDSIAGGGQDDSDPFSMDSD